MKWGSCSSVSSTEWTSRENKLFENALAVFDSDTPDRWEKVAARVPGKTPWQVMRHYESLVADVEHIDSGLVPIPRYVHQHGGEELGEESPDFRILRQRNFARGTVSRVQEQERKKGVPWSQEEHRLFLLGLNKYGKGDWRGISRNFVVTRTPTQVASHAQKYFIRLHSGSKDRRRPSIHDITSISECDLPLPVPHDQPSTSASAAAHSDPVEAVGLTVQSPNTLMRANDSRVIHVNAPGLYNFHGGYWRYPSRGLRIDSSMAAFALHPSKKQ